MCKKPNILFILADDHRYSSIRTFGEQEVKTPILDQLAEEGTSFCNTHIMGGLTAAVCVPSRAVLHTGTNVFRAIKGKNVHHADMSKEYKHDFQVINENLPLLAETFGKAGYRTHAIGKWHNDKSSFVKSFSGGDRIFFGGMSDHYHVPIYDYDPSGKYPEKNAYTLNQYSTEMFCDAAVDYIESYQEEDPFMLYLALTSPHDPRTAPKEYADIYDADKLPLPDNFMEEHPFDNGHLRLRDEELAAFPRDSQEIKQHLADYYAMITHTDAEMGKVIEALKQAGKFETTIIVYTSDHGLAVGQHGLLGKQNLYDHSVHVPLIIRGQGLPSNKRIGALTYSLDLYPTLCELANIDVPESVEGSSLVPLIHEESQKLRNVVGAAYMDIQRMVRDERWKLIKYSYSEERHVGTNCIQLFDMQQDPHEINDLSNDPSAQNHKERLLKELIHWQQDVNDPFIIKPSY